MGTEAFWVPAVMAAVSGGAQYANQRAANSRSQDAQVQNIIEQEQAQSKAAGETNQLVKQIAQNNPKQIQQQATSDYVNQLRKNAAGSALGGPTTGGPQTQGQSTSALPASVGADPRYAADLARSQNEVQNYGDTYANDLGAMDAAVRQRQNEGLAMETLGTNLNTLGAASWARNFVNQLRSQAAGAPNPWVSLGAGLLGRGAEAYAMNSTPKDTSNPFADPNLEANTDAAINNSVMQNRIDNWGYLNDYGNRMTAPNFNLGQ